LQGRAYNPLRPAPAHCLPIPAPPRSYAQRQRIAFQYPLLPEVASSASSLLANTRSSLKLRLAPAHCLPIPAPPCIAFSASSLLDTRSSLKLRPAPMRCLPILTPLISPRLIPVGYLPYPCPPQFSKSPANALLSYRLTQCAIAVGLA
jgi:hypothetical protein